MEFGILGPLQIWHNGAPVPLRGRILPKLVAVLLLEAGHVVPLSKLVEALWDDRPPAAARRRIQNTVSDVRAVLSGGSSRVDTVGEGYRLRVDPGRLDSLRFERAVRGARGLAAAGDRQAALAGLREALALWRGKALGGMTGRLIESGAQRWDETRLAAVEDRIDLELALGTGEPVVTELRELLDEQPYRQRAAGQLMVALYRDGRVAEALETYRAMRARLSADLGIDPDRQLRDLHGAVLRADPSLNAPGPEVGTAEAVTAEARPRLPVPAQLPADTKHFTGRHRELAELDTLLATGGGTATLSALSGIGGAGKTALALHWAHRVRDRFPDGQLYVNLRGHDRGEPLAPHSALAGFLRALGVTEDAVPSDVSEAGALYRSSLADRRLLVILDNARDAAQVRPLLPGGRHSFAIVTSRHRLAGLITLDDAHPITVGAMSADESRRLLTSLLGTDRISAESAAADRLARLCAGVPLALRIVATNLVEQPHTGLAEAVDDLSGADRLERLAVDGDPSAAVAATFDLSYQSIDPTEQELYLRLSLLPGADFGPDLAAVVAGGVADITADADPGGVKRVLARLEAAHRIEQYRPARYRFHDLVREYARRKAFGTLDEAAVAQTRERVIDWYFRNSMALPFDEYDNLVSTFRQWSDVPGFSRLLGGLVRFANAGHNLPELIRLAETGIDIGDRSGEPIDLVRAYNLMLVARYSSGDVSGAADYGRKMVEAMERTEAGDVTGAARANLGMTLLQLGRYTEALPLIEQAAHAAEGFGEPYNVVSGLSALGAVHYYLGRYAEAEPYLRKAVTLNEGLPGGPASADCEMTLAELCSDTGRRAEAEELYDRADAVLKQITSTSNQVKLLRGRAAVLRGAGSAMRARTLLTNALRLAVDSGNKYHVFIAQCELAEVLSDAGRYAEARDQVDRHTDSADPHHTPETLAVRALTLCKIHTGLGNHAAAVEHGRRACDAFAVMPAPLRHARSLAALADAHAGHGDGATAAACRAKALAIFTQLDVPEARQLRAIVGGQA